jgi:hypothetical protein
MPLYMSPTSDKLSQSAMSWALWKALDWATARLLEPAGGGLRPAQELDQEALFAAVRDLSDDGSSVVQALAQLLGRPYASPQERDLALDGVMGGLSREQGLVVAAVVLYADTQSNADSDQT